MAALGPVLATALASEINAEMKGAIKGESSRSNLHDVSLKANNQRKGSILHHFKYTTTQTREGEYQESADSEDIRLKASHNAKKEDESCGCCCFGKLKLGK